MSSKVYLKYMIINIAYTHDAKNNYVKIKHI